METPKELRKKLIYVISATANCRNDKAIYNVVNSIMEVLAETRHAADVPTERLCMFCNESCEDAPTERGWAEVPYNKGLHFDCARKVAGIADVPDDEAIDKSCYTCKFGKDVGRDFELYECLKYLSTLEGQEGNCSVWMKEQMKGK